MNKVTISEKTLFLEQSSGGVLKKPDTNQHESDTSQHESDTSQHKSTRVRQKSTRVNTNQLDQ